ncbi:hypothetical protein GGX14DRAFT_454040 [Mycena pura]|uniref:Uncharacterized protein n=1 Tax=Mycena pura TaxID=153505 RepID=A0AAD6VCL1_9AGAR|nr:hypothetical protein GGX14DRAFT_454040 [Mycena pura]
MSSTSIASPAVANASTLASSPLSTNLGTTNATNGVISTGTGAPEVLDGLPPAKACDRYFCERGRHARFCSVAPSHIRKLSKSAKDDKFARLLAQKIGPGGSRLVVGLLASLSKVPAVGKLLHSVDKLTIKTLEDCGTVEKLLSGGNVKHAYNGKNLNRKSQKQLFNILKTVVPSCTACTVTKLVTLLVNGRLLNKLPLLNKLLPKLVPKLLPTIPKLLKPLKPVTKPVKKILDGVLGGEPEKTDAGDGLGLLGIL